MNSAFIEVGRLRLVERADDREDALEVQSLEHRPAEEGLEGRAETTKVLDNVLIGKSTLRSFGTSNSGRGVLTDCLVCWPMGLLALWRTVLESIHQ